MYEQVCKIHRAHFTMVLIEMDLSKEALGGVPYLERISLSAG